MRTKEVPCALPHEVALCEEALGAKDEVEIAGVMDEHAWRQRRHGNPQRLVAEAALARSKPRKQVVAALQEAQTVADERERATRLAFWAEVGPDS